MNIKKILPTLLTALTLVSTASAMQQQVPPELRAKYKQLDPSLGITRRLPSRAIIYSCMGKYNQPKILFNEASAEYFAGKIMSEAGVYGALCAMTFTNPFEKFGISLLAQLANDIMQHAHNRF